MKRIPIIEFRIGRRKIRRTSRDWLVQKKDQFSRMWKKNGSNILRRIERNCRISFPKRTKREGMRVYLCQWRKGDPDGDMEETKPLRLNLYLRKSDTWTSMKNVLVHELVHCLMWQKYYFDFRIKEPTFFEDIFADELVTSLVEYIVLERSLSRKACKEALDYAMSETVQRLSRREPNHKLVSSILEFVVEYKRGMKRKESNILKERKRVLKTLPSLLPETLDNDC